MPESKPSVTLAVESLPTRGGSLDGGWTDPDVDGGWTEPPLDGGYTQDNSYLKEYKAGWTAFTSESLPTDTFGAEVKPTNTRTKEGVPA